MSGSGTGEVTPQQADSLGELEGGWRGGSKTPAPRLHTQQPRHIPTSLSYKRTWKLRELHGMQTLMGPSHGKALQPYIPANDLGNAIT